MAAISFQRINRAALAQRRTLKKQVTITTIFYVLATLLFSVDTNGTGGELGLLFGMMGFCCGFITFNSVFRDLHNRQQADITLSMPMTGTERFISKILCCFYVQIIPALITAIVAGNISYALNSSLTRAYANLWKDISYVNMWQFIFLILSAEIFMLAVVALCSACCGTKGESIFFQVLFAVFQASIPALLCYRFFEYPTRIDYLNSHDFRWNLWGYGYAQADERGMSDGMLTLVVLLNILISIVILFVAGLIYKKRDARVVGTPVANKPFFEIMMFLGLLFVYLLMFYSRVALWGILIGAVAYIIINIIVSRKNISVKMFLKWSLKFVVSTACIVAVFAVSAMTGGFGYISTHPDYDFKDVEIVLYNYYSNNKELLIYGKNITREQQDEVLDIFQKYAKKAIDTKDILFKNLNGTSLDAGWEVADIHFDDYKYEDEVKELKNTFIEGCKFRHEYMCSDGPSPEYELEFDQAIVLDESKLNADYTSDLVKELGDELKKLPYLKVEINDPNAGYDEDEEYYDDEEDTDDNTEEDSMQES